MKRGISKKWLLLAIAGCATSVVSYGTEPVQTAGMTDSTVVLQENGLKSLIDTTINLPQGMEGNAELMPREPAPQVSDSISIDPEDEFYKTYGIYNRMLMPIEFDRPYPTDVWKLKSYIYSFESDKKWLDLSVESNPELDEYFQIDSLRQSILHNIIFQNPLIVTGIKKAPSKDFEISETTTPVEHGFALESLIHTDFDISRVKASDQINVKPGKQGYWTYINKSSLQFSQNYISSNWQQGGESNLALNGSLNMKANYTHVKGLTLDNELEWRASFFTAPSDTVRSWRVTDDLFRLTSNLALKAFQKWNYSTTAEFKTRFFNSFKTNSNVKLAAPLSPGEFSFSIGMSYANTFKKLKVKDFNLALSPFSYNWKFILDDKVDETRYGITKGKSSLNQIGSRLDLKFLYEMKKNISWNTRFYYFTTYENVESEWENTVNFAVNRFFSTKIFFHLKYDDKRTLKSNEDSYFQFKELLSFGFSYVW